MYKRNLSSYEYSAIECVKLLTPIIRLKNFLWIISMFSAFKNSQISQIKFITETTYASNKLNILKIVLQESQEML